MHERQKLSPRVDGVYSLSGLKILDLSHPPSFPCFEFLDGVRRYSIATLCVSCTPLQRLYACWRFLHHISASLVPFPSVNYCYSSPFSLVRLSRTLRFLRHSYCTHPLFCVPDALRESLVGNTSASLSTVSHRPLCIPLFVFPVVPSPVSPAVPFSVSRCAETSSATASASGGAQGQADQSGLYRYVPRRL